MRQRDLFAPRSPWQEVLRCDAAARALADEHYPRQTKGAAEFMPPGTTFVLLTADERAVWGVVENRYRGRFYWRVSIFRNTGRRLSSYLIRAATRLTRERWRTRHGTKAHLRTEVDPRRVRHKRDPGRCFLRAGWRCVGVSKSHRHRGALVFEAP